MNLRFFVPILSVCLLPACTASSDSSVSAFATTTTALRTCSGFGCEFDERVSLNDSDLIELRNIMADGSESAEVERQAVGRAVAWREEIARKKLRHPRDVEKAYQLNRGRRGQMDCVDESINTLAFLKLLHTKGLLKHHVPARRYSERGFIFDGRYPHKTATMKDATGKSWAVDSWKKAGGIEPQIVEYSIWKRERRS